VDADLLFSASVPCPFPVIASPIPFPTLLFFSSKIKQGRPGKHCKLLKVPSEKLQPVAKVGGDQIHLVPVIFKVGGDASNGSHRVVETMSLGEITPTAGEKSAQVMLTL